MKSYRIRFTDGSQIDFREVSVVTKDNETVEFTYDDPEFKGRTDICIMKRNIIFLIELQ
jgi:hypothetical protein